MISSTTTTVKNRKSQPLKNNNDKTTNTTSTSTNATSTEQLINHNDKYTEHSEYKDQIIYVEGKTYNRKFTISKAYLDLIDKPNTKPSIHKFIHRNRILIFSLILLYIAIDGKNHGIEKLIHHTSILSILFINPFDLLIGLTVMHVLSFLLPLFNFIYHHYGGGKTFKNLDKRILFSIYIVIQLTIGLYSAYFILYDRRYPLGTQFYLGLVAIVLSWKQHSYFMVTNYKALHTISNRRGGSAGGNNEEIDKFNNQLSNRQIDYQVQFKTLYQYSRDYFIYLFTPTLIYDHYYEITKASKSIPKEDIKTRVIAFLKELYSAFAIMITAHYIHVEFLFPALAGKLDVYAYLKILIPAEINFQLQYYLLYHSVLSLLADLTDFKDRLSFYDNYWAAVTTKEILAKWSKPVHGFLFRHVLSDMKSLFKIKTVICLFTTMIFSGFFHEVLVTSITKRVCMPWSTFSLLCCAISIIIENKFSSVANSKYYHWFVRFLLFIGHGLFYFSYFYFCFSQYDIATNSTISTCPTL